MEKCAKQIEYFITIIYTHVNELEEKRSVILAFSTQIPVK